MDNQVRIMFAPSDLDGCGYYRVIQLQQMLQTVDIGVVPLYAGPRSIEDQSQHVTFTQRVCDASDLMRVMQFKEATKSKVIIDYDDLLWAGSNYDCPRYNVALSYYAMAERREAMKKYLDEAADAVICTTDYLKARLSEFVSSEKITVIPNCLSMRDWLFPRTTVVPTDESYLYAGSVTHYHNEKRLYGDFSIPLANYLRDKKFGFMGDVTPWFLTTKQHFKYVKCPVYSKSLYQYTRDWRYTLAPLAKNSFNMAKSDIKYLESCAVGRVCLVSDFDGSPYSKAHEKQKLPNGYGIKDISSVVGNLSDSYAEVIEYQYDYLNSRWLDNRLGDYAQVIQGVL